MKQNQCKALLVVGMLAFLTGCIDESSDQPANDPPGPIDGP